MNKEELVKAIEKETALSKADCKKFLDAYTKVVQDALVNGESVKQTGFVIFSVRQRAGRKGHHPQTRKEINIMARNVIRFVAGKQLKEAVNSSIKPKKNKK